MLERTTAQPGEVSEKHYIEIDCPPGPDRPGHYLPQVLEGTELKEDDFINTSRSFGNWIFKLKAGKDELYDQEREKIKAALEGLYNGGYVRYCSW